MAAAEEVKILGIAGSVRQGSYNVGALRAARDLLPEHTSLDIAEIKDIPLFSEEANRGGFPPEVVRFREKIAAADAILFATPEYIFSVTARLKNALEWAYIPPNLPFSGKACAIMGATVSKLGCMRGQYQLRQICTGLNTYAVNAPFVDISDAKSKFDAEGNLLDDGARELIRQLVVELRTLTLRLRTRG